MSNTQTTSGGIGFTGLLTLILLTLKLLGQITISWWWVFAPLWAPALLLLVLVAIYLLGVLVVVLLSQKSSKKSQTKNVTKTNKTNDN